MKKISLIILAFILCIGCSKNVEQEVAEKAFLNISLKGEQSVDPLSKASGVSTGDSKVNDFLVFVFRTDGALDIAPAYSSDGSALSNLVVTTMAKEVYVVANTGALASGPFTGVSTKSELISKTGVLIKGNTSTQSLNNVWMEGNADIVWGTGENITKGTATVTMSFLASKLLVTVNTTNYTGNSTFESVAIGYAGGEAKFFATDANKATQSVFYSGDNSMATQVGTTVTTALLTLKSESNIHFYTFANNGNSSATIITVIGKKANNDKVYWPISFNLDDAGYVVNPATIYNVTLNIKGEGVDNPEVPVINGSLDVTIAPATWKTTVNIDKDFN